MAMLNNQMVYIYIHILFYTLGNKQIYIYFCVGINSIFCGSKSQFLGVQVGYWGTKQFEYQVILLLEHLGRNPAQSNASRCSELRRPGRKTFGDRRRWLSIGKEHGWWFGLFFIFPDIGKNNPN